MPDPLTKQRSPWRPGPPLVLDGVTAQTYRRNVHDGQLTAIVAEEPDGWHLSVSMRRPGRSQRYPTWDELTHARYTLLPEGVDMVMHLPPLDEYVALHDTCFHLHEAAREPAGWER